MNEQQYACFQILKDVDKFCKMHDIKYYLAYGTALGAVRHAGFIPWDDDIDLMMTYDNYKKFCSLAKNEFYPEKYFLQNFLTDEYCYNFWLTIRRKNTTCICSSNYPFKMNMGVSIDIFPLFESAKSELGRMIQRFLVKFRSIFFDLPYRPTTKDKCKYWVGKILTIFKNKKWYLDKIYHVISSYPNKTNEFFETGLTFNEWGNVKTLHKSYCSGMEIVRFEGEEFSAPTNIDSYLKDLFGNYRELPPLEKRYSHGKCIFSLDKDYTFFLKDRVKLINKVCGER